jgi:hypothetical protein
MKCQLEGCEANPMNGDHFFRITREQGGPWVCGGHLDKVSIAPEVVELYARFASFFQKEKLNG